MVDFKLSKIAFVCVLALGACTQDEAGGTENEGANNSAAKQDAAKQDTAKKGAMDSKKPLPMASAVQPGDIGSIKVQTTKNGFWFTGQPSKDDFAEAAKRGMKTVINFRTNGEIEWDEGPVVEQLGMSYVHLPFRKVEDLTDEFFAKARAQIAKAQKPAMLQCGSSNRVGAVWYTYLTLDEGADDATAMAEAKSVGLRSEALAKRVQEYVNSKR